MHSLVLLVAYLRDDRWLSQHPCGRWQELLLRDVLGYCCDPIPRHYASGFLHAMLVSVPDQVRFLDVNTMSGWALNRKSHGYSTNYSCYDYSTSYVRATSCSCCDCWKSCDWALS